MAKSLAVTRVWRECVCEQARWLWRKDQRQTATVATLPRSDQGLEGVCLQAGSMVVEKR